MFILLVVKDTVPVQPKAFGLPPAVTILDALNKKYANKLVPGKGLAISVFDILTAEDGKVTWGNGLMYYKVSFRLMLFAPFNSEVIVGTVMETTKSYIRVSLGFFKDVYIMPSQLPPNSAYDMVTKKFFYYPEEEDRGLSYSELLSTALLSRLYVENGEPIRFRVDEIDWQDVRPEPAGADEEETGLVNGHAEEGVNGVNGVNGEKGQGKRNAYDKAGMRIHASIAESGLGIISWWGNEGVVEEEMMMQG